MVDPDLAFVSSGAEPSKNGISSRSGFLTMARLTMQQPGHCHVALPGSQGLLHSVWSTAPEVLEPRLLAAGRVV